METIGQLENDSKEFSRRFKDFMVVMKLRIQ